MLIHSLVVRIAMYSPGTPRTGCSPKIEPIPPDPPGGRFLLALEAFWKKFKFHHTVPRHCHC